jgi:hypothetical protein
MATALVLLVLTGHAFVVSATHFHRARPSAPVAAAGPQLRLPQGAQEAPPAAGHEQCLLCRLQRNLVTDLQHSTPALQAPPAEPLGRSDSSEAPARGAHLLARSGRAPPLA